MQSAPVERAAKHCGGAPSQAMGRPAFVGLHPGPAVREAPQKVCTPGHANNREFGRAGPLSSRYIRRMPTVPAPAMGLRVRGGAPPSRHGAATLPSAVLAAALLSCAACRAALAQEANRYEPISSWTAPYVEHLIRAGILRGLDPLTRPLRRGDVELALAAVDTAALPPGARGLVRALAAEFREGSDSVRWQVDGAVGALAASDARRWPLRPAAESAGVYPQLGVAASLELPHLVLATHPHIDNRLLHDPDYRGKKDRFFGGRNDEAYALYESRYFGAFFGIADRNWGPPEAEGLLLSPSAYGFDHLLLRLGPRRFRIELLATKLDDIAAWEDSTLPVSRALTLHRLVVQPSDAVAFSLFEGVVYSGTPGDSRGLEPWYLNPLNSLLLAQYQDAPQSNALVGLDAAARIGATARLAGQVYFDDFQIDRETAGDKEPAAYGLSLVGSGGWGRGAGSWSLLYTRVTNLAYRTPAREEQYTAHGVGIGRDFSDCDQITARVTAVPARALLVGGEVTHLRQGEGDMRRQYPAVADFPATPTFLQGVVERTWRVAAQATWTPRRGLTVSGDFGRHFVANSTHVSGRSAGRWVWRLAVELRHRERGALRFS